ncbi:hypothetical protein [Persephonella sp. KM09-Lau-8]|uniref:hypothetical protein n=1 Tax=Persephonella sp. KM09-Lau-8 TaxID=1158345 RepID=UPI0012DC0903|nr:hypothetical protein [Persephonella sp. KM09-Lau-8]
MKNRKTKIAVAANKSIAHKHAISTFGRARAFKNKKKEKPSKKIKNIDEFLY